MIDNQWLFRSVEGVEGVEGKKCVIAGKLFFLFSR